MKTPIDQALFAHRISDILNGFHAGELSDDQARAQMASLKKDYQPVSFRLGQEADNRYYFQLLLEAQAG
jgi:hypothetical protein